MKHKFDRKADGADKEIGKEQHWPEKDEVQTRFFVSKNIVDVVGDIWESMHGTQFTQNFSLTIYRKAFRIEGEKRYLLAWKSYRDCCDWRLRPQQDFRESIWLFGLFFAFNAHEYYEKRF